MRPLLGPPCGLLLPLCGIEWFRKTAEFLGVSKQAKAIRLKQLGLLKKEYLQSPYALVALKIRMMIDATEHK